MKTTTEAAVFGLAPGQTLLAVHAHPDDFEMFTSAAAGRAMQQDIAVVAAIATRGEATTLNFEAHNTPGVPIADIRGQEAARAFAEQGIPKENQEQYKLPDGKLSTPWNRARLGWKIARTLLKHGVSVVLTPGEHGVDGHDDHIAVHETTVFVAKLLRRLGKEIAVWAPATGEIHEAVDVDPARKKILVQMHGSQFPADQPALFEQYAELLAQERYVRIL